MPYNSYDDSLENLALDPLIIPLFKTFVFILITSLLDIVLLL